MRTLRVISIFYFIFCKCCLANEKQLYRERVTFDNADVPTRANPADERINLTFPGLWNLSKSLTKTLVKLCWTGTKWCGPGNTASNYDDLGDLILTDSCCRAHDHCDSMASGESKNNLTNTDFFTKLHCDCDKEFYVCLHEVNSNTSNQIGKLYFGLRSECYRNDYPIVECIEYDTAVFIRRCYRYILDESKPKRFQWFDLPLYNGKYGDDYWRSLRPSHNENLL